jgi:hypothetical protein
MRFVLARLKNLAYIQEAKEHFQKEKWLDQSGIQQGAL